MDEETVILEASNPKCPVCGDQVDFIEADADEEGVWRCSKDHWTKAKKFVMLE